MRGSRAACALLLAVSLLVASVLPPDCPHDISEQALCAAPCVFHDDPARPEVYPNGRRPSAEASLPAVIVAGLRTRAPPTR